MKSGVHWLFFNIFEGVGSFKSRPSRSWTNISSDLIRSFCTPDGAMYMASLYLKFHNQLAIHIHISNQSSLVSIKLIIKIYGSFVI